MFKYSHIVDGVLITPIGLNDQISVAIKVRFFKWDKEVQLDCQRFTLTWNKYFPGLVDLTKDLTNDPTPVELCDEIREYAKNNKHKIMREAIDVLKSIEI